MMKSSTFGRDGYRPKAPTRKSPVRAPWVMELPCDSCGRKGNDSNPVVFLSPDGPTKKSTNVWSLLVGNVRIFMPLDEVTATRRAWLARELGLPNWHAIEGHNRHTIRVMCADCIARSGPPIELDRIRSGLRHYVLASREELRRMIRKGFAASLPAEERKALECAKTAAYAEATQEGLRHGGTSWVRMSTEGEVVKQEPIPLRGRRRPPREKLGEYARALDRTLCKIRPGLSIQDRARELIPPLRAMNPYIARIRDESVEDLMANDDPRLLDRVRKLLRQPPCRY